MAITKSRKPTYKFPVEIPVPGEKPEKVDFTFRYKTETELKDYLDKNSDKLIAEFLADHIDSWALDDEFGEFSLETLKDLADVYPGAIGAIHSAFYKSRHQGRAGN